MGWASGLKLCRVVCQPDTPAPPPLPHDPSQMEATYAGQHVVGPGWQRVAGRPVCSPKWAPGPRLSHSGTPHCSTLDMKTQPCHRGPRTLSPCRVCMVSLSPWSEVSQEDLLAKEPVHPPPVLASWTHCSVHTVGGLLHSAPHPTAGPNNRWLGPWCCVEVCSRSICCSPTARSAGSHHCLGHSPGHLPRPPGTAQSPRLSSLSEARKGQTYGTPPHPHCLRERNGRRCWSERGSGQGWGRGGGSLGVVMRQVTTWVG